MELLGTAWPSTQHGAAQPGVDAVASEAPGAVYYKCDVCGTKYHNITSCGWLRLGAGCSVGRKGMVSICAVHTTNGSTSYLCMVAAHVCNTSYTVAWLSNRHMKMQLVI